MDSGDPHQHWTTSHRQNQARPKLTAENLTFADGNRNHPIDGGGGGATFDRGGQRKVINSTFTGNRCDATARPAAPRSAPQPVPGPGGPDNQSVFQWPVPNGGAEQHRVSWVIRTPVHRQRAIGHGANPARPGTDGGGSGGAIYTDGDRTPSA
jgi:hypothetical protein